MNKSNKNNKELSKIENKLRFYRIEDDIFLSALTVVTGKLSDLAEYIDKRYDVKIDDSSEIKGKYIHLTNKDEDLDHKLIWFNSLNVGEFLTINHEVGHFVFDLLNNCRSTPHTDDTDETYEYYREYIVKKVFSLSKKK